MSVKGLPLGLGKGHWIGFADGTSPDQQLKHVAWKRQGQEDWKNDRGMRDRGNDETGPEMGHVRMGKPNNLLHTTHLKKMGRRMIRSRITLCKTTTSITRN